MVRITIFLWTNFIRLLTPRHRQSTRSSKIRRKLNVKPLEKRISWIITYKITNKLWRKMLNKNINSISTIKSKLTLIFSLPKTKHSKKTNSQKEQMILKWPEASLSKKTNIDAPYSKISKSEKNKTKLKVAFMSLLNKQMTWLKLGFVLTANRRQELVFYRAMQAGETSFNDHKLQKEVVKA